MKEQLFKEKYPLHTLEIAKSETVYETVEDIIEFLKVNIFEHLKR